MLKPNEPPIAPGPDLGDLLEQLVDDAKTYAKAEISLVKARVEERAGNFGRAAAFGAGSAVLVLVAAIMLFVTIAFSLATRIGILAGGMIAMLIAAGLAGLLAWLAKREVDRNR